MKSVLEIKRRFSFPPKTLEDTEIMKYTEFLEIEVYDDPGSPEIFYSVAIDSRAVKCSPRFLRFLDDCGSYETVSGTIKDIFKYFHEDITDTDLLFFIAGDKQFLIDQEGYVHLEAKVQLIDESEAKFYESALADYYGFKVYEKERPRI